MKTKKLFAALILTFFVLVSFAACIHEDPEMGVGTGAGTVPNDIRSTAPTSEKTISTEESANIDK